MDAHPDAPTPRARFRRRRRVLIGLAVLAVASAPAAVFATHTFTDVPTSAFYHSAATSLKTAGITNGCGVDTFCPDDPVTRGQVAVFMNRALPRTNQSTTQTATTASAIGGAANVGDVTITVPGAAGAGVQQYVTVWGKVTVSDNQGTPIASSCPCAWTLTISDDEASPVTSPPAWGQMADLVALGTDREDGVVFHRFTATPGPHTYTMKITVSTPGAGNLALSNMVLVATTAPFPATG